MTNDHPSSTQDDAKAVELIHMIDIAIVTATLMNISCEVSIKLETCLAKNFTRLHISHMLLHGLTLDSKRCDDHLATLHAAIDDLFTKQITSAKEAINTVTASSK